MPTRATAKDEDLPKAIKLVRHSGESRNPGQWRFWVTWMPDQVRHDGKNNCPKTVFDFIFKLKWKY
jgi:hypothetical protein